MHYTFMTETFFLKKNSTDTQSQMTKLDMRHLSTNNSTGARCKNIITLRIIYASDRNVTKLMCMHFSETSYTLISS